MNNSGARNGRAKLTLAKVRKIRSYYMSGRHQSWLAAKYKVSLRTIWSVVNRKSWVR